MRQEDPKQTKNRDNEKGAALVMALLVSFLLLAVSAGLLLEATANTQNVSDSIAEQQAYQAAESGIQAAVNVLRDNVRLSNANLIVPNPTPCATAGTNPELCKQNRIDYLKALNISQSNLTSPTATQCAQPVATRPLDCTPRLSRWMTYNAGAPDRVTLGGGAYVAQNGYAYSLDISDPDHTGSTVLYSTRGKLGENDGVGAEFRKTYGNTTNGIVVEYIPQAQISVDTTNTTPKQFGAIKLTKYGNGVQIINYNRFEIDITMTQPYYGSRVLRGHITPNTCSGGVCTTPNIRFDSITFTLQGSIITLQSTGGNAVDSTFQTTPPTGFNSQLIAPTSGSSSISTILGSMTSPEPLRLLIKSTGYGPRGSTKQLEAVIQKNFFNGLTAPATLTLIGPPSTTATAACPTCDPATPAQPATSFHFALGNSNAMLYSGRDAASTDIIPPIGAWGDANVGSIFDEIDDVNRWNRVTGTPSDITADTPPWLSTPRALDDYVKMQVASAIPQNRYFANGVQPSGTYPFGNPNGTGLTVCDGDCTLTGDGGGILIVTGKLTLHGAFSFKGIILVTGQGGVDRRGAGNGTIEGNMIIAPYVNSSVYPSSEPVGASFLAAQYDLSGGGSSTIQYNSNALNSALMAVSNFVLGVVEK